MKNYLVLAAVFFPAIASAHAMLDHAVPAVGSTVDHTPTEVRIYFDQPVGVEKSSVHVTDSAGKSITAGSLRGDAKDDMVLIIPVTATAGKIKVNWAAFCPPCGHTTHGDFTFTVRK